MKTYKMRIIQGHGVELMWPNVSEAAMERISMIDLEHPGNLKINNDSGEVVIIPHRAILSITFTPNEPKEVTK